MTDMLTVPESAGEMPPTPTDALDEALATLRARSHAWCATDVPARIELLRELLRTTLDEAPRWVATAAATKGIRRDSPLMGEEWGSGPAVVLRNLALLADTLDDIVATGRPQPPGVRTAADGQVHIDVLPTDVRDRLLFTGFSAEARLDRSVSEQAALASMGRIYRDGHDKQPGVALVLGAGNITSIAPTDVLYQLFALDRVVLLKLNPVTERIGEHIAAAFRPLVDAGLLRLAYGGAQVGRYLTDHDEVDTIHVTGSSATYDAIAFGTGEEGEQRKRQGRVRTDKPISAELGNITPVIVVPGPWSDADLAYHGDNIASMVVNNAGFNCVAARLIIQHRAWARRQALLDAVRGSFRRAEQRVPFYPGARERWERFVHAHRQAEWFGPADEGEIPFTLIPELDPTVTDDVAFTEEAFCGVVGEVGLDTPRSIPEFLDASVDFVNDRVEGTLGVTILVHPRSLEDPEVAAALDRAIDRLRYGTVVINHWLGVAFGLISPPWGAYPGSDPTDIQSGCGMVHNTYLLEDVEKSVVRGPFRTAVPPVWFHTHRTAHRLLRKLVRYIATDDPRILPGLLVDKLRG